MEKAAPKLVGNISHLHWRIWLKIDWRKAGYFFYLISKKLNWDFDILIILWQCPVLLLRSSV